MARDIRDMFREDEASFSPRLKKGHEKRFLDKLDNRKEGTVFLKDRGNSYLLLKIAAVIVVAVGIGLFFFMQPAITAEPSVVDASSKENVEKETTSEEEFQLRDVSPEFRKIENYYLANINVELAKLDITKDNKLLIDSFMEELSALDKEYKKLNIEVKEVGLNEQTIEAMVANLQLRMELLYKLKNKLKEIKQSNNSSHENLQA
ncbi:hypothetical protein L1I30_10505 [Gillisia sp. M10.2A]|uniref:Anti-sigma factor n=1 Tax=Gillisia lutea TaxID=2909668 RepID=A0ABS9EGU1_9FLAO|nr:hypothetical protein [Gillisia lutea]MCF4102098.1 hypothetical protein [Gillisia lutea]